MRAPSPVPAPTSRRQPVPETAGCEGKLDAPGDTCYTGALMLDQAILGVAPGRKSGDE